MRAHLHTETIMLVNRTLAVAAIALSAGASHAWTLVYANDAAGNATAGSLQSLRTAVTNGASVKVVSDDAGKHAWSVQCAVAAVKYDASQAVVCANNPVLAADNSIGAQFSNVYSPPQTVSNMLNTRGQFSQAIVRLSDGSLIGKTLVNVPMQWFVD